MADFPSTFGDNIFEDAAYQSVVNGWNDKRKASSQVLSGLTPFVELYCVFGNKDILYSPDDPSRFTAIANRLCNVEFVNAEGGQFSDGSGNGITRESRVARVGSDRYPQSQVAAQSAAGHRRWAGAAGINDLAVSRGSSGSFNVKYDMSITLPDPELMNENYEYSKLLMMNSPFLIIYGWNVTSSQKFNMGATTTGLGTGLYGGEGGSYPPVIEPGNEGVAPTIRLNHPNGGFWYASLVVLYKYEFSFDNVGHLNGKLNFITQSGNFLSTLQTGAVATPMLKQLMEPLIDREDREAERLAVGLVENIQQDLTGEYVVVLAQPPTGGAATEGPQGQPIHVSTEYFDNNDLKVEYQYFRKVGGPGGEEEEVKHGFYREWEQVQTSDGQPRVQQIKDYIYDNGAVQTKERTVTDLWAVGKHTDASNWPTHFPDLDKLKNIVINPFQGGLETFATVLINLIGENRQSIAAAAGTVKTMLENENETLQEYLDEDLRPTIRAKQTELAHLKGQSALAERRVEAEYIFEDGIPFTGEKTPEYKFAVRQLRNLNEIIKRKGIYPEFYVWPQKNYPGYGDIGTINSSIPEQYIGEVITNYIMDTWDTSPEGILGQNSFEENYIPTQMGTTDTLKDRHGVFYYFDNATANEAVEAARKEIASIRTYLTKNILIPKNPNFGRSLNTKIFGTGAGNMKDSNNPNYRFFEGRKPKDTSSVRDGPYYDGGAATNTRSAIKNSTVISVPLQKYDPIEGNMSMGGDEDDDEAAVNTPIIPPASYRFQPVYYFLGSVLEALRISTQNPNDTTDPGKIRFYYAAVPSAISAKKIDFPMPTPTEATSQNEQETARINRLFEDVKKLIEESKGMDAKSDEYQEIKQTIQQKIKEADREVLDLGVVKAYMDNLEVRTTYDIPVSIKSVNNILNQNQSAPAHNLINQILGLVSQTIPAVRLATRPHSADDSVIEVFIASVRIDNVVTEVFSDLDITQADQVASAIAGQDPKIMLANFGHIESLVENFNLGSKMDPNAFASFRLPAVVGGAYVDIASVVNKEITSGRSNLLGDIRTILEEGLIGPGESLKELDIVTLGANDQIVAVKPDNLESFLTSTNPALRKASATLVESLMAQNANLYTKIMALQAEEIQNPSKEGQPAVQSFFGTLLSSFLRTATLTIHGTVGLNTFQYIYLKGLLKGIEGMYLITNVNESLNPGNFTTTLECKLMQYRNNNVEFNPFAYGGAVNLNELGKQAAERGEEISGPVTDWDKLVEAAESRLKSD